MTTTPEFRRLLTNAARGEILIPLIRTALFDPDFEDFTVLVRGFTRRPPDGWFHPSTHPTISERALYHYIVDPDEMVESIRDPHSVMAVTQGTFWHDFIQKVLMDAGVLQRNPNPSPDMNAAEWFWKHEGTRARGHCDGLIAQHLTPHGEEVFEWKCLTPETRVALPHGGWIRADEVREGQGILAWDGEQLVHDTVSAVGDNGTHPIYAVHTQDGRILRVTSEHPVLTQDGWVEAQHLERGNRIKVAMGAPPESIQDGPALGPDEAWGLGAMVGDGGCTTPSVTFSNSDPLVIGRMDRLLEEFGCSLINTGRPSDWRISQGAGVKTRNRARVWLGEHGLLGHGSRTKSVPPAIWQGGPNAWIEFMSGYFDTDGHVSTTGSYPHLVWTSVNHALLVDGQAMLAYLGIRATIMRVVKGDHESWRLLVRDGQSVLVAQRVLALSGVKAQQLAAIRPHVSSHGNSAQVGWDKVLRVDIEAPGPTIAIEVTQTHTHVTEGLVTHNTMNQMRMNKLPKGAPDDPMVLSAFRKMAPEYYAQGQEYMRLSGRRYWRCVLMAIEYPYPMREITMEYDPFFAGNLAMKYERVLKAVEAGVPPSECCGMPKDCMAAQVCSIGRIL